MKLLSLPQFPNVLQNGSSTRLKYAVSSLYGSFVPPLPRLAEPSDGRVPVPPFDEGHLMLERNLLHDLKEISSLSGQFHFTPEGLEYYQHYYNSRLEPEEEYEDERLRGYSSRKDVHVLKLAMVLSMSDGDSMELNPYYLGSAIEGLNFLDKGFQCVVS